MLRMYHAGCAWSTTKWASKDRKPRHRGIFSTVTRLWKCGCEWALEGLSCRVHPWVVGAGHQLVLSIWCGISLHKKTSILHHYRSFCCNFFLFFFSPFATQNSISFRADLLFLSFVAPFFSGTCQAAVLHGAAEREGSQLHLFQMPGPMGHLWPRLDFIHRDLWVFPKIVVPPNHPFWKRVFHNKPSILGHPYFWKHPYDLTCESYLVTIDSCVRSLGMLHMFTSIALTSRRWCCGMVIASFPSSPTLRWLAGKRAGNKEARWGRGSFHFQKRETLQALLRFNTFAEESFRHIFFKKIYQQKAFICSTLQGKTIS